MSAAERTQTDFESVSVPLWREALFGMDWLALRTSPVYYGFGIPHGTGAPVVVIPGFLGSDTYLIEMYNWLRRIGYKSYYSRIGRNAECPNVLVERLFETMDKAHKDSGQKLHLIGHSLGGLLARSAAIQRPEQVEQVICLASPFRDIRVHPMVLAAADFVRGRIKGRAQPQSEIEQECYTGSCQCAFATSVRDDAVPAMKHHALYTATDGVVDWRSCVEEDEELNIRVSGTHSGLAFNPQVYRHVAKLLAPKDAPTKRRSSSKKTGSRRSSHRRGQPAP